MDGSRQGHFLGKSGNPVVLADIDFSRVCHIWPLYLFLGVLRRSKRAIYNLYRF